MKKDKKLKTPFRIARDSKGLTQEQLSQLTGISQPELSKMERGERGATLLHKLQALSDVLDTPLDELVSFEGSVSDEEKIIVKGSAQVGAWIDNAFNPKDNFAVLRLSKDPRFPGLPRFAIRIASASGESGERVVLCIAMAHLQHRLENGKRYLVQRQDNRGKYEISIRRLIIDESLNKWLLAEGVAPSLMVPVQYFDEGPTVKILARIVFTGGDE